MNMIKTFTLILLAHLATACVTLPSQRADPLKRVDGAIDIEAYEDYLARHPFGIKSDTRRFHLAMTYLEPEAETYNWAKARNHLWQLESSAASPYREAAVRVLSVLKDVDRLRSAATLETRRLERMAADVERLRGAVEIAESRVVEQGESASRLQVELQTVYGKLRRLGKESDAQKQEIDRLTRELQVLKRIDTQQAP